MAIPLGKLKLLQKTHTEQYRAVCRHARQYRCTHAVQPDIAQCHLIEDGQPDRDRTVGRLADPPLRRCSRSLSANAFGIATSVAPVSSKKVTGYPFINPFAT